MRIFLLPVLLAALACDRSAPSPAPAAPDPTRPVAAAVDSNVQTVTIKVTDRGYDPATIELKAGVPTRLIFDQQSKDHCVAQVHIPTFNVPKTELPFGKQTVLTFTPSQAGTFKWQCGMDMMSGTILVKS